MLSNTVDYDFRFNKEYYVVNLAQVPQQAEEQASAPGARAESQREETSRGEEPLAPADAREAQ